MLVFDPANDVDGRATSGALKGTVPYTTTGERVDFQAFSVAAGMYNWVGHVVTARAKLQSGGNLNPNCPLTAQLYVSQAPDYNTSVSAPVQMTLGNWVTVTYDLAESAINIANISQMGIQFSTGAPCTAPLPDGGAGDARDGGAPDTRPPDAGPDAGPDAAPDAAATDAAVTDAGSSDGGDAAPLPITATTAVIFVDNVVVSVR